MSGTPDRKLSDASLESLLEYHEAELRNELVRPLRSMADAHANMRALALHSTRARALRRRLAWRHPIRWAAAWLTVAIWEFESRRSGS